MRSIVTVFGMLILVLAQSCTSTPTRAYLDESTAATIAIAQSGWVFARERSDLAIHAQDYITLTPVEVNRSGARTLYLYCQVWSTIDRRQNDPVLPTSTELNLIADDRKLSLDRYETDLRKAGFGHEPIAAPNRATQLRLVVIDASLLRFLSHANTVRIAVNKGVNTDYFVSWRDGREAFAAFATAVDETATPHR